MSKNLIRVILILFLTAGFLLSVGCAANNASMAGAPETTARDAFAPVEVMAGDAPEAGQSVLSSFSTAYNQKSGNRSENIRLASDSINGTVIAPGETFSFNDTVGPTNRAHGYKLATVFFNKEETKGYGGGVCQVSSTLFNAAEMAGLEIVERHTHSLNVSYVEKGRDATTSHKGKLDLKFTNILPYPVVIHAQAEGGVLTVEVCG